MCDIVTLAAQGRLEAVTALLGAGSAINQQVAGGHTAAMAATCANNVEMTRLLFARGAGPDFQDDMPHNSIHLCRRAGISRHPRTCQRGGHVDVVRYLLVHTEVALNHINELGWMVSLEAIIFNDGGPGQQETIRILIAHGADVSIADAEGVPPMEHARQRGFTRILAIMAGRRHAIRGRSRVEP